VRSPAANPLSFLFRLLPWIAFLGGLQAVAAPASHPLLLDGTVAGSAIIAVGERGIIVRSTDSGRTWETMPSPVHATLTGITFADRDHGWAAGHDGIILHTRDGGLTWTRQFADENPEASFLDIVAVDSRHVVAIGAFGLFCTTVDGGHTWEKQKVMEEDLHLNRISLLSGQTLGLAGENGTLLRTNPTGKSVSVLAAPYEGSFYGILPLDENSLLAYGMRGHVFRSDDAAVSWHPTTSDTTGLLVTALRLKTGLILLAGQARVLVVSQDNGRTFATSPAAPPTCIAELVEAPDGAVIALGEAGATRIELPALNVAHAKNP
jgi:photosystem II stability/assembly factor-like uncharacterized protein